MARTLVLSTFVFIPDSSDVAPDFTVQWDENQLYNPYAYMAKCRIFN